MHRVEFLDTSCPNHHKHALWRRVTDRESESACHSEAAPNQIVFFDTTLRDGEQSPGCTMHHEEKLRMADQLASLGVDVLEAGFAIASEGDFNDPIRANSSRKTCEVKGPRIAPLARCRKREDIEAAARAVEPASA